MQRLWYTKPATDWVEALPIGNGRLGAMVYGEAMHERYALNEDTFWSGAPIDSVHPDRQADVAKIRTMLANGDVHGAEQHAEATLTQRWTQSYLPLAELQLTTLLTHPVTEYVRDLDLTTATASTRFVSNGVTYLRRSFVSIPDDVLVIHYDADVTGELSLSIGLTSRYTQTHTVAKRTITLLGAAPLHVEPSYVNTDTPYAGEGEGMRSCTMAHIDSHDGILTTDEDGVHVTDATHCTIIVSAATSFVSFQEPATADEKHRAWQSLGHFTRTGAHRRHVAAYSPLYGRSALVIKPARSDLPTDERLRRLHADAQDTLDTTVRYHGHASSHAPVDAPADDVGLLALLYNMGRYLLISSSQPGTQAANLQGIWNDNPRPAWSSNYTININTQMNYWAALTTNLRECQAPLTDLIEHLAVDGARAAAAYGCRGWTAHHNTDIWAQANAVKGKAVWFLWPYSAAWLCLHVYEEYLFSNDDVFARERALPLLRGAAEFHLDWLQTQPDGTLQSSPSTSPENLFVAADGQACGVSIGSEADIAMTRALWLACLDMAERLALDEPWLAEIRAALPRLPAPIIGADGRLQEWRHQPAESEPGHRHISHLYGLYPSAEITPWGTPDLAAASRESLAVRLAHGGGHTGWSAAWVAACYARLGDGEAALAVLHRLLRDSTYPSMLGSHPPFQIDGSLGSPAAIAEMIVQSHAGVITLFPAIPKAWRTGKLTGIRLRGGITIDIEWKNEAFVEAFIVSETTQSVVVHAPFDIRDVSSRGVVVSGDTFTFKAGVHYEWKLLDSE